MAIAAAKGLLLILGALGLGAIVASDDKKTEKPIDGPGPTGQPLPPGVLCEAPNGVVMICHEFQPTAMAALQATWTTIGSGNQYPCVGISMVQAGPQSIPVPAWIQQQLALGRLVLIACDGARKELIACERGEEIVLCPRNPLRNAVLVEPTPGAGQQPNPNVPGVPTPGPQFPQPYPQPQPQPYPQPQPQPQPGPQPGPTLPGGFQVPGFPPVQLPDFGSPTPPPWWPPGMPWPGAQGQGPTPQPGPQPQPQPQPQPGPGVPAPNPNTPPPGWPAGWQWPPFGMPLPDFTQPAPPAWWPPGVPWPGAQQKPGPGVPPPVTPGVIDRSWKPPIGQVVAKGPDGYYRHIIRPGDIGTTLAQWYTGSVQNTAQLEKTNPELVRVDKDGNVITSAAQQPYGWKPWQVGQVLVLPLNWDGSKGPPGGSMYAMTRSATTGAPGGFFQAPSTRNANRQAAPMASPLKQSLGDRVAQKAAQLGAKRTGRA